MFWGRTEGRAAEGEILQDDNPVLQDDKGRGCGGGRGSLRTMNPSFGMTNLSNEGVDGVMGEDEVVASVQIEEVISLWAQAESGSGSKAKSKATARAMSDARSKAAGGGARATRAQGPHLDDIMEWYDGLDREQVKAVIEFAARSLDKAPALSP